LIGETLAGRYAIERLIGEGAMGNVYEARHTGTHRRVAVKVISDEMLKHASVIARFKIEARAAGRIDSQHIAQVLDVGEDEERNVPFLVMELLHGEDLTQTQERLGVLPPDLVARIAAHACVGLSRAHAAGIVHRDIKPGNLFLSEHDDDERIVKILDFGIAKVKSDTEQGPGMALTRTGNLVGTPLYMPPEQARGDKVIDARADIWSLGVVMYQALTGATPHASADSLGKLIIQICSAPAQPIEEIAPWVPPELAAIVMKCIEIDAPERFQSADEVQKALRAVLPGGSAISPEMIKGLSVDERASRPVARAAAASVSRSGSSLPSFAPRPLSGPPPPFAEPSAAITSTTVMDPSEVPKSPSSMFSRGSMPPPGAAVLQPAPLPAGMTLPPASAALGAPGSAPASSLAAARSTNRALLITIAAGIVALGAFTAYRLASQSAADPAHPAPSAPAHGSP
jgi:serine/threonine-protein kinase